MSLVGANSVFDSSPNRDGKLSIPSWSRGRNILCKSDLRSSPVQLDAIADRRIDILQSKK